MDRSPSREPRVPDPIDTEMFGIRGATAAHLIEAERPALVDVGSATTVEALLAGLRARGVERVGAIVLTHVHFDHAGAAGHLAERFPDATVYVPERVAGLLTEPGRLIDGVRSVWGPQTERLFGLPVPVPEDRVRAIADGAEIDLGDRRIRAVATPGHTRAHLSYLDEETGSVVCGDALGIHLPDSPVLRPATPPSDFSFPDALASIERIRELGAERLFVAHFGDAGADPGAVCDQAAAVLTRWHETFLREREYAENDEDLLRRVHCALEASLEPVTPGLRRRLEVVNPAWLNVAGMNGEADRAVHRHAA